MYRIFSMSSEGRLYQLSSRGWVVGDGAAWEDLTDLGTFLRTMFVPALPNGQVMVDSYVGLVSADGLIVQTFSYDDVCSVWEG